MIKLTEIDDYRPEEILILSTGSQGEPLSALTRMAFDDHPQVELTRATRWSSRPRRSPATSAA